MCSGVSVRSHMFIMGWIKVCVGGFALWHLMCQHRCHKHKNVLPWEVYTQKQVHAAVHQSLQAIASMATLASSQSRKDGSGIHERSLQNQVRQMQVCEMHLNGRFERVECARHPDALIWLECLNSFTENSFAFLLLRRFHRCAWLKMMFRALKRFVMKKKCSLQANVVFHIQIQPLQPAKACQSHI